MYLNKAFIAGNLCADPELKALPSGVKVCNMRIATNRVWKDQQTGEKRESVDYHSVVVFGRQGETSAQYLRKGSKAMVEGRIQTRSWETPEGKRYKTEIVAENVQFGEKNKEKKETPYDPDKDMEAIAGTPKKEEKLIEEMDF